MGKFGHAVSDRPPAALCISDPMYRSRSVGRL
jgi:hypothetical protein